MGSLWKENEKWRIRWRDASGHYKAERYPTRQLAEHALQRHQIETAEVRAGLRKPARERYTFDQLFDLWSKTRVPQKRSGKDDLSIIRKYLRPAFGSTYLDDLTIEDVEAFTSALPLGQKSIHNVLTLLVSMMREAKRRKWIEAVPEIKKPSIPILSNDFRYLKSDSEIQRFLRAASDEGPVVFTMYATAIYTGMRAGELAGLKWEDVDLDKRLITVRRSYEGPTKAGYIRHVPILDALLPILRRWRLQNPLEIVFPNQLGQMHTPSARTFQEILHRVLDRAGFPMILWRGQRVRYITFHCLRHTFASHWVMNGGDLFKLQKICGWKSHDMVLRYAHLAPEAFAADYDRLGQGPQQELAKVIPIGDSKGALSDH